MSNIPRLIRKTRSVKQIISYMDTVFDKVLHTTLNPNGPGAIRIHLIPPKKQENELNRQYLEVYFLMFPNFA